MWAGITNLNIADVRSELVANKSICSVRGQVHVSAHGDQLSAAATHRMRQEQSYMRLKSKVMAVKRPHVVQSQVISEMLRKFENVVVLHDPSFCLSYERGHSRC